MAKTRSTKVSFASGFVEYSKLPPHEAGRYTSHTSPYGFGVSFTGHQQATLRAGSDAAHTRSFAPGTVGLNGPRTLTWLDVAEPSESVDIHPAPHVLEGVAALTGCRWQDLDEFRQLSTDEVVWGSCIALRVALLDGRSLPPATAATLITNVTMHIAINHLGGRRPRSFAGRLEPRTLAILGSFLQTNYRRVVPLHEMASAAAMSPFHLHRSFHRTVGVTPATFAMAIRMERAHRLIISGDSVRSAADYIGITDLSQFRRTYRRFFGTDYIGSREAR